MTVISVSAFRFFHYSHNRLLYYPRKRDSVAVHVYGQEIRDALMHVISAGIFVPNSLDKWRLSVFLGEDMVNIRKRRAFFWLTVISAKKTICQIPYITALPPATTREIQVQIERIRSSPQVDALLQPFRPHLLTLPDDIISFCLLTYLDGKSLALFSQTCSATLSLIHTGVTAKQRLASHDPSLPLGLTRLFLASFGSSIQQFSLERFVACSQGEVRYATQDTLHLIRMLPVYAPSLLGLDLPDSDWSIDGTDRPLIASLNKGIGLLSHLRGVGLAGLCAGDSPCCALVSSLAGRPWERLVFPRDTYCTLIRRVLCDTLSSVTEEGKTPCSSVRELHISFYVSSYISLFSEIPELSLCRRLEWLELNKICASPSELASLLCVVAPQLRELYLTVDEFLFTQGNGGEESEEREEEDDLLPVREVLVQSEEAALLPIREALTRCKCLESIALRKMRLPTALVPHLLPALPCLRDLDVRDSFDSQEKLSIGGPTGDLVRAFSKIQGPLERLAFSGIGDTGEAVLQLLPCLPPSLTHIAMTHIPLGSISASVERRGQWEEAWKRLTRLRYASLCSNGLEPQERAQLLSAFPPPCRAFMPSPEEGDVQ